MDDRNEHEAPRENMGAIFTINDRFAWEPVADGCFVYSTEVGQVMTLNAAAELALSYFDGESSLEKIYQELSENADWERKDFLELVDSLVKEKVLLPK